MKRHKNRITHKTELDIEQENWPAPPKVGEPIELAMLIAGKVWRVIIDNEPAKFWNGETPKPPIDFPNSIIRVGACHIKHRLPKRIALAHRLTCAQRLAGDGQAMVELLAQLMDADGL